MAEIDGEQYAARKLGCEISADPLNPLDPIKKVCKSHHPDEDLSILDRAYRRAVIQHSAQRRKSGEPYIIHPLAVSQILADLGLGPIVVAAGLLHDTVEDTSATIGEIECVFSPGVAVLVNDLTDVSCPTDGNRVARKQKDLLHTAAAQPRAKTVKLMDLVHNSVSIVRHDRGFAAVFPDEMAKMLGVLQDASDPNAWELAQRVDVRARFRMHATRNLP